MKQIRLLIAITVIILINNNVLHAQVFPVYDWTSDGITKHIYYNIGNVGIGTDQPGSILHIANQMPVIKLQNDVFEDTENGFSGWIGGYDKSGDEIWWLGEGSTTNKTLGLHTSRDGYDLRLFNKDGGIIIKTNGNIGIGTDNPENSDGWHRVLNVHGDAHSKIITSSSNVSTGIWSHNFGYYGAPAGGILGTYTNHPISFITNKTAKMTITPSGNVGIGTTNPDAKLTVADNIKVSSYSPRIILQRNTNDGGYLQGIQTRLLDGTDNWYFGNIDANRWAISKGGWNSDVMFNIHESGNIGIGTTTPSEKLEIGGDSKVNIKVGRWTSLGTTGSGIATILGNNVKASTNVDGVMEFITSTADGAKAIKMQYNEGISFHTFQGSVTAGNAFAGYERMRIDNEGNVGIGTANTTYNSETYKLGVKGKILTTEIKLINIADWADFVFEPTYKMPTLKEVENFIKINKHLPDVPSEKEVRENGINVGEMNATLLQKIEELTLYTIEQQKILEKQNKRINQLEDKLNKIENSK
ncbi:MAG: hypothetical protein GY756_00680 [bacterium]|nr:hypothetical protein [bacterium]